MPLSETGMVNKQTNVSTNYSTCFCRVWSITAKKTCEKKMQVYTLALPLQFQDRADHHGNQEQTLPSGLLPSPCSETCENLSLRLSEKKTKIKGPWDLH